MLQGLDFGFCVDKCFVVFRPRTVAGVFSPRNSLIDLIENVKLRIDTFIGD